VAVVAAGAGVGGGAGGGEGDGQEQERGGTWSAMKRNLRESNPEIKQMQATAGAPPGNQGPPPGSVRFSSRGPWAPSPREGPGPKPPQLGRPAGKGRGQSVILCMDPMCNRWSGPGTPCPGTLCPGSTALCALYTSLYCTLSRLCTTAGASLLSSATQDNRWYRPWYTMQSPCMQSPKMQVHMQMPLANWAWSRLWYTTHATKELPFFLALVECCAVPQRCTCT